jgi:hypothetical protein
MKKQPKPWTQSEDNRMLGQDFKQVGLDEKGNLVRLGDDLPQTLPLTDSAGISANSRRQRFEGAPPRTSGVNKTRRRAIANAH